MTPKQALENLREYASAMNPELDVLEQFFMALEPELRFYAKTSNYTNLECGATNLTTIEDDKGSRAQRLLEQVQPRTTKENG